MQAQRLSIVTPTRNGSHLLDRLYNSLIHQTCDEFEHILVDTSEDNSTHERWCRDFAPHLDGRFRYARVHLDKPDMAAAFEYALDQAQGEYVCPMTHKALWRSDGIENIHKIIDKYSSLSAFAFRSLYTPENLHGCDGDFRNMIQFEFGSSWNGDPPRVHNSRDLFYSTMILFGKFGYEGPQSHNHLQMPFASHAIYSRKLLDRVRDRFGTLVAGKFAGDSRLGYRVMDLEAEVYQFDTFEPRVSSMHSNTGGAGSRLQSWTYLCEVFRSLSVENKQVISRSPFGYLPLWAVMTYWELYSVMDEARGNLIMGYNYPSEEVAHVLRSEIANLVDLDEPLRAGLQNHVNAIVERLPSGYLSKWF